MATVVRNGGTGLKLVVRNPGLEPAIAAGLEPALGAPGPLGDAEIATRKPGPKLAKLAFGGGLYLWCLPASAGGAKHWRLRFRLDGKQREYAIGPFGAGPEEFTVAAARERADEARALLAAGKDPVRERRIAQIHEAAESAKLRAEQAAKLVTLQQLAEDWFASRQRKWAPQHRQAQRSRLDRHILPALGSKPLGLVDAPTVLAFLQSLERDGRHEVLSKCRIMLSQVFRYGIATARASDDPTKALRGAFERPAPVGRATISPTEFPRMFKALGLVPAEPITRLALAWCIATCCRTHEMRGATWAEIGSAKLEVDGAKRSVDLWRVEPQRMKMRQAWTQPLSPLALEILNGAREYRTSDDPRALVFPGFSRAGTLSENALLALLARAGYYGKQTTHGFRASFATWAHERFPDTMAVELCLAHRPGGVLGVYHRGEHLASRLAILTEWAEHLRELGIGALLGEARE